MKHMRFLFTTVLFSGLAMLNSCSKSDTTEPLDQTPVINFVGGTGFVSSDVTLTVNQSFKVGITAFSNSNSGAKLTKFAITRVINNVPSTQDSTINTSTLNLTVMANANSQVGTEKWFFKVTDKNNESKEISFTITTVSGAGPINTFSMKILGSYANATGSSFASIDGTVYTLANAKINSAKIDWLYFYGASAVNHATIASPKDPVAETVYSDLINWAVRNNTLFKKVTDAIVWADITDDAEIVAQTASGVTETRITNLAPNDILAFIAASGKKGLIKVEAITGTTDGTITISVKVQQ
jgi:hypothetical protein